MYTHSDQTDAERSALTRNVDTLGSAALAFIVALVVAAACGRNEPEPAQAPLQFIGDPIPATPRHDAALPPCKGTPYKAHACWEQREYQHRGKR
jgi:hypothetical protein